MATKNNDLNTLTTGQIAKYCGVHPRTVTRWIDNGKLPAYQLPERGDRRVRTTDFVQFLSDNNLPIPQELTRTTQRVLIVEDEPPMASAIQRALRLKNFETRVAHDGFEAGRLLESFIPDLITLDLMMPGIDGLEVLKKLKANPAYDNIRILVISAAIDSKIEEAFELGADAAISKPFTNDELIEMIEGVL